MPIYEYSCPKHGKFEALKKMNEGQSTPCPQCNTPSRLVLSPFNYKIFNPFTKDGEGFTSKVVSNKEYREMNRAIRER